MRYFLFERKREKRKGPRQTLALFSDRNGIITGSAQGIGEATARLFVTRGIRNLVLTDRNGDRGRAVARELEGAGCRTHFVEADLAEVDACRRIVAEAEAAFGGIHVLVNAAGLTTRGSIFDATVEVFDRLMAINARAPMLLMQACIENMIEHRIEGAIVNVVSITAHGGPPKLCPYSMSKAALAALTRNAAYAVMPHRIRVNGLMLGWADTPTEDLIQQAEHPAGAGWRAAAEASLPFGRLIQPDEAARAIAWLASSESGMMTGTLIDFDQSVLGAGDVSRPSMTADR